jgi:hypothetical protein
VGGGHVLAGEARLSMGERLVVAVICASFVGCNSAPLGKANSDGGVVRVPPSQSAVGAKSRVPAGEAHLGFASGSVKADVNLKAFDISKLPVSEAQLAECRAAGACDARATSCTSASPAPDEPALCVEPETARSYCAWVGGRLPRLAEWLVAARGPDIRRFAWGSTSPSCQQHPRGTLKQPAATNSDKSVRDLRDSGLIADRTEHLNGGPTEREVELPCTKLQLRPAFASVATLWLRPRAVCKTPCWLPRSYSTRTQTRCCRRATRVPAWSTGWFPLRSTPCALTSRRSSLPVTSRIGARCRPITRTLCAVFGRLGHDSQEPNFRGLRWCAARLQ